MYLQPFLEAQWELCCDYLLVCFNSCWLKLKKIYCLDLQKHYRLLVLEWIIRGSLSEVQRVLLAVVCQEKTRSLQYSYNQYEWICSFSIYKSSLVWTDLSISSVISQSWPKRLKTLVSHLSQCWWLSAIAFQPVFPALSCANTGAFHYCELLESLWPQAVCNMESPMKKERPAPKCLLMFLHCSSNPLALHPHLQVAGYLPSIDLVSKLERVIHQQLFPKVCPSERTILAVTDRCNYHHIQDIPTWSGDCSAKTVVHTAFLKK